MCEFVGVRVGVHACVRLSVCLSVSKSQTLISLSEFALVHESYSVLNVFLEDIFGESVVLALSQR